MIDSTEPAVIAAALAHLPGRGIVNSINMENGRKRIDAVLPLVRRHGAAVVALTIDEQGMAKTRDRKLEIARRIHDIATTRVRPGTRPTSSSMRSPSRSRPARPSGSTRPPRRSKASV